MKLVFLLLLLFTFSSITLTEVVGSFKRSCPEFFFRNPKKQNDVITPTIFTALQYKHICQRWKDKYRFATLFDTVRRIPVYSAYKFPIGEQKDRREDWKNEPQLENLGGQNMEVISENRMDEFFHQAVNRDYKDSDKTTKTKYTRGHVFPNQYAADQDQADSTFAFTNVAPQTEHSNGEWAEKVEEPMKKLIMRLCKPNYQNPTYIVTGVVPGNNWIPITRKVNNKSKTIDQGVNIPSYYWTAFCCNINNVRVSKGYLALQNEGNIYEFSEMSVKRLNKHLTELYKQEFIVFGDWCLT